MGLFFGPTMVLSQFRFVELGRVAYIAYGPDKGKLCVIVDVVDQNRALVDGPCSGVPRQQINFKTLHLTQFRLVIPHSLGTGHLIKLWKKEKIQEKWEQTTWCKKLAAKEKRSSLSDFDRFKLMKAKQARNRLVNVEFGKLKKQARKAPAKAAPKRRKAKK